MQQEHRITYKAGITRTPSDFLCADGELAECINLATDNEELKPVVQPVQQIALGGITEKIRFIHKYNGEKRYITIPNNSTLKWYKVVNGTLTYQESFTISVNLETVNITSIGKTLIVTSGPQSDGMVFFLWKVGGYEKQEGLPEPEFDFYFQLYDTTQQSPTILSVSNSGKCEDMIRVDDQRLRTVENGQQENFNDLVVGMYSKNKRQVAQKKGFCEPFFLRYALELYDGSYTNISNPILMMPFYDKNSATYDLDWNFEMQTWYAKLYYKQSESLELWKDIVKDIVIFVSEPVSLYDLVKDQKIVNGNVTAHGIGHTSDTNYSKITSHQWVYVPNIFSIVPWYDSLVQKTTDELRKDIEGVSVFHKLCGVGLSAVNTATDLGTRFQEHDLENISTKEWLETDDYYSRCKLYPQFSYAYNSRLNIANVSRGFFDGFGFFIPWDNDNGDTRTSDIYVNIKTDNGTVTVKHTVTNSPQRMGVYFYYPDSRATHVVIVQNGSAILTAKLKEHTGLNGAYYFAGIPGSLADDPQDSGSSTDVSTNPVEQLPNYIITSEVNNPWIFNAAGYNKVSTGKIIGMSTLTMALSQDNFGKLDLLVFSETGIFGLTVGKDGYFDSVPPPISRHVCINPKNIFQTDYAVFFVAKQGLMMIGPDGMVRCVSEQMNGKTFNTSEITGLAASTDWATMVTACQNSRSFLDYIRDPDTFLAYDYTEGRIYIICPDTGIGFAYLYNMKDGTISKTILPATMTGAVNDYPDYLLQGDALYSFYDKPREEEVSARQLGFLLTRPMKLAGPVSQSSLRQLKNVGTWAKGTTNIPLSCVKTEVFLSDDMVNWYADISRFGAAARYYRLALYTKLLSTERLSGTILTDQDRRSNNIR